MLPGRSESASPRTRVFFALWPDEATANRLHRVAVDAQTRFGGRVMRHDTLHLTVAFVGAIERERVADLIAAGNRVAPPFFELSIDLVGEWQRKNLVWAGLSQPVPALSAFVASLRQELLGAECVFEDHSFVPHVTLLRNATCERGRTPISPPVRWRCHDFVLVESQTRPEGAHYAELARWRMQ